MKEILRSLETKAFFDAMGQGDIKNIVDFGILTVIFLVVIFLIVYTSSSACPGCGRKRWVGSWYGKMKCGRCDITF